MNDDALRDTWIMFQREHDGCSIDRMLCDPKLRTEFLREAIPVAGQPDEQSILWSLVGLRKRKLLATNEGQ